MDIVGHVHYQVMCHCMQLIVICEPSCIVSPPPIGQCSTYTPQLFWQLYLIHYRIFSLVLIATTTVLNVHLSNFACVELSWYDNTLVSVGASNRYIVEMVHILMALANGIFAVLFAILGTYIDDDTMCIFCVYPCHICGLYHYIILYHMQEHSMIILCSPSIVHKVVKPLYTL